MVCSLPGSSVHEIVQARMLEWVAIPFSRVSSRPRDRTRVSYIAGDPGLIPGLGRSPGVGNGNPLQYFSLENFMDRGAWQATVHGVAQSWRQLSDRYFHSPWKNWCLRACSVVSECVPPGALQPARLPCPGVLQARMLEWVAVLFSRASSRPRDRTDVSCASCTGQQLFTTVPPGKPKEVPP